MHEAEIRVRGPRRAVFPERIITRRCVLRRIAIEDAAGWKAFNNAIAKRMDASNAWPIVPSVVYARNEILHYIAESEQALSYTYAIIDKRTGGVIGDFRLKHIDRTKRRAEFGHALHPGVWGTGLTYEILDTIRRMAKRRGYRLWAKVDTSNIRSWRSLEKYRATYVSTRIFTLDDSKHQMRVYELSDECRIPREDSFSERVYALISKVPAGKVTTYRDVAHALGTRSYRAVGQALRCNPYAPSVPCQRVVASDGRLGGFMGERDGPALRRKIALLSQEGVGVQGDRVVDFDERRHEF